MGGAPLPAQWLQKQRNRWYEFSINYFNLLFQETLRPQDFPHRLRSRNNVRLSENPIPHLDLLGNVTDPNQPVVATNIIYLNSVKRNVSKLTQLLRIHKYLRLNVTLISQHLIIIEKIFIHYSCTVIRIFCFFEKTNSLHDWSTRERHFTGD